MEKSPAAIGVALKAGSIKSIRARKSAAVSRYTCEGSVEIQEDRCDVHTWATFTELACMAVTGRDPCHVSIGDASCT